MTGSAFVIAVAIAASGTSQYGAVWPEEVKNQNEIFERWWGEKLEWKFDNLPEKGSVPKYRVPYAGYIYPDTAGGTVGPMWKYDQAFHRSRSLATSYERWDISAHRVPQYIRGRWGRSVRVYGLPHWAGHCNGWTTASIRHAEPQYSVKRNGVTFTPADIKGLLAEVYMWTQMDLLGGEYDYVINPATLHVIIANWLGRQSHPVAMETTPGGEVWNFPVYAFTTSHRKRNGDRQVEVKMNVAYQHYTEQEHHKAPNNSKQMRFHYLLDLNEDGKIVGGRYVWGSSQIDMLWVSRRAVQGGQEGNEKGNPYLNVEEVLAIWRDSVPKDLRSKWVNIDSTEADSLVTRVEETQLAETPDPASDHEIATAPNADVPADADEGN